MAEKKLVATARAIVVLELVIKDTWGHDCTVAQIHKQAKDAAVSRLRSLPERNGVEGKITLVGEPDIKVILVEEA